MSTIPASSSTTTTGTKLPMATILHMLTLKLSPSNYLYWHNQIRPLLANQELIGHVDGSISPPSKTTLVDSKEQPNPDYSTWFLNDQQAVLILNSSLTEEAMAEILGLSTARQIWTALEAAYSNTSLERMHLLRDTLRQLTKGSSSVAEYGRKFKSICDQLSAIGHPVSDTDKTHWFLCGLGSTFESCSTAIRTTHSSLPFRDLLTKAESQEQFLVSLHPPSTLTVAFVAHRGHQRPNGPSTNRSKPGSSSVAMLPRLPPKETEDLHIANYVEPMDITLINVQNSPCLWPQLLVMKILLTPFMLDVMFRMTMHPTGPPIREPIYT
ncbi:putative RNA-directed DNA polymerase [Helianthus annuus]|nr:putative RNA-directed DNA polymerase [Helianthus annuus]